MKLATVVLKDIELLRHFLAHYSVLGVTQFLIGVYEEFGITGRVRQICRGYSHIIVPIKGWFDARKDIKVCQDLCRRFVEHNEWWIIADLDEFHEYPMPLPRLSAELEEGGYCYLQSCLLDRVTVDGSCPAIRPHVPLWDQFPAAAFITRRLMRAKISKVLLIRGHAKVSPGHHVGRRKGRSRVFFGGIVHHFKWYGDIGEKIRERRQSIVMRKRGFHGKCDRFLRFWKKHRRMPIAGEYGFHYPLKPVDWPDSTQIGGRTRSGPSISKDLVPASSVDSFCAQRSKRSPQQQKCRNIDLYDLFRHNRHLLHAPKLLSALLAPLCGDNSSCPQTEFQIPMNPRELGWFLTFMATYAIRSVLDICTGTGGRLFTFDSYLRAVSNNEFARSLGVDNDITPLGLDRYHSRFPTCTFIRATLSDYKPNHFFDMSFIDARHFDHGFIYQLEQLKPHSRFITLHGIAAGPIRKFWKTLKRNGESWEFVDETASARRGLGVIKLLP